MPDTLLDEVKVALRVSQSATDGEIQMWIDAALADMERVGIDPEYLSEQPALVKAAIVAYAKSHYGMDVLEAPRFEKSYRQIVCDLMNSPHNLSAQEDE